MLQKPTFSFKQTNLFIRNKDQILVEKLGYKIAHLVIITRCTTHVEKDFANYYNNAEKNNAFFHHFNKVMALFSQICCYHLKFNCHFSFQCAAKPIQAKPSWIKNSRQNDNKQEN